MTSAPPLRDLGLPEYIQSDGPEAVLEQIADVAGEGSVTTLPRSRHASIPGTDIANRPSTAGSDRSGCSTGRSGARARSG